jgi:hypothetical protein
MELENLLGKLYMEHLEAQLETICEQAAKKQLDYKTFLAQSLQTLNGRDATKRASRPGYGWRVSPG